MNEIQAKLISDRSVTIVVDNEPITIRSGQPRFGDVYALAKTGDWESALEIMTADVAKEIDQSLNGNISIQNGEVCYKGKPVHDVISQKIVSMVEQGNKDYEPWVKFVDKLFQNPHDKSREGLFDFLCYKELPLTEDGDVVAWKGVRSDDWSVSGNTSTLVLQGEVDSDGRIKNSIGDTIEVDRADVDSERSNHCSYGLHVGSWDYASSFGHKIKMVSFDPRDAVSVPTDCNFQKLRVCKYKVLADYEKEEDISDAVLGRECEHTCTCDKFSKETVSAIESYIHNRLNAGLPPTIKQVQSRMKGTKLSSFDILEIAQELGFFVDPVDAISQAEITF